MGKIKRLVEIDEKLLNKIKDSDNMGFAVVQDYTHAIADLLANSEPYDNSGDLISREALRAAFHKRIYYFNKSSWDEANSLLDSEPSVEMRPQGKWNNDKCSVCGCDPIRDFTEPAGLDGGSWISAPMKFCPNCGADMRKGGAE